MRNLETTLGPDTGDLSMRFGLHSGPVTAGVLMGRLIDSFFWHASDFLSSIFSDLECLCLHPPYRRPR